MAVDLFEAGLLNDVRQPSGLYEAWLRWHLARRGKDPGADPAEVEALLAHAEGLALELHREGRAHALVGPGRGGWFRRCPLRVHTYDPSSTFSFRHKSLQEYLVARALWGRTQADAPLDPGELAAPAHDRDLPVLQFYADLAHPHPSPHP